MAVSIIFFYSKNIDDNSENEGCQSVEMPLELKTDGLKRMFNECEYKFSD